MADFDITYDPITVNSGPVSLAIAGLDNIKIAVPEPVRLDSTLKGDGTVAFSIPDPIKTDSAIALSIPQPIRTDSKLDVNAGVDLQPVVLDQCLRISLGPLPPTQICLPNHQRLAFSLFGVELVGITVSGEARIVVGAPERQTRLVGQNHKPVSAAREHKGGGSNVTATRSGDLRIRLG